MLHADRVFRSIYCSSRRRFAHYVLRRGPRPSPPPVLREPVEAVVERHGAYLQLIQDNLPSGASLRGKRAMEVGPGDCLAVASLFLGMGASRVDMIEVANPVVNEKQQEVLRRLKDRGFPMDSGIIVERNGQLILDPQRTGFHQCFLENLAADVKSDWMFSNSVMEHVEDLDGFYRKSAEILSPGGWMVHSVDLGGHEWFEDPLPPLDFQTYPNWLYWLMFPKYWRATRLFMDEHLAAIERHPFEIRDVRVVRREEPAHLEAIWPKLRPEARARSKETVGVVHFVVMAQRKS